MEKETIYQVRNQLTNDLLYKTEVLQKLESDVYKILHDRKINVSLITAKMGMKRVTAYYRLKNRLFTTSQLIEISRIAKDIYK